MNTISNRKNYKNSLLSNSFLGKIFVFPWISTGIDEQFIGI